MSQVARGFVWSGIERFSIQGISFILSIIIARIVSPSSYGLIVMIQVFLSFSQIFIDGGFANALIQKKERTEIDYYTVFLFNMAVAIGLYFVFFFAAPSIAVFYHEPQLTDLTRVISLNLIFSSLSIVQKARLTIALDFKTQTKAGILAVLISGICGVICAYSGMEVWALVVQGLVSQIIISLALMWYSRWLPKLQFSKMSFKKMFSFGSKLMANNLITGIYINLANLIIGKKYSAADLAFYNRGFTLTQFPSANIAEVMNRIIFPVLSRLQDDRKELIDAYEKYLHLSNYIILPLMMLLIVLAHPLIEVLLTEKWLPAVPYIQIYSLNFMLYATMLQAGNPVAAIGHSGVLLKYQFVKRVISFVLLIATVGISVAAVCWGVLASSVFEVIINMYVLKKDIGVGFRKQVKPQMDVIFIVLLVGLSVYIWTLFVNNAYIQLFVGGIFGVLLYIVATFVFNIREKEMLEQFYIKAIGRVS